MSQSIDFGRSTGKSPKKSREGSLTRSQEKLPKASLNSTYTMEKFVNHALISNIDTRPQQEDFDRDSNYQDIEALMQD